MTLSQIRQDISRGVVPLLLAIALAVATASLAFGVGMVFSDLTRDSKEFRSSIGSLQKNIALVQRQVAQIRTDIARLNQRWNMADPWTQADHIHFCIETERKNPGWQCPDFFFNDGRRQRQRKITNEP